MNEITHQTIQVKSLFILHSLLMDFRINYDCSSKNQSESFKKEVKTFLIHNAFYTIEEFFAI